MQKNSTKCNTNNGGNILDEQLTYLWQCYEYNSDNNHTIRCSGSNIIIWQHQHACKDSTVIIMHSGTEHAKTKQKKTVQW